MIDLKCTTTNCEHNKLCHCLAGVLHINEKGICSSKMKRDGGILEQDFSDFEASENLEQPIQETFIECKAQNCLFNSNYNCVKNQVSVADGLIRTKCFSKKT